VPGCPAVRLAPFGFPGSGFRVKQGYTEAGFVDNFTPGHRRPYFQKQLA
jgi:hypothetical protein